MSLHECITVQVAKNFNFVSYSCMWPSKLISRKFWIPRLKIRLRKYTLRLWSNFKWDYYGIIKITKLNLLITEMFGKNSLNDSVLFSRRYQMWIFFTSDVDKNVL